MTTLVQQTHELDVFGKRGIALERGQGAWVWDDNGKAYIDCIAGHGAANLGHGNPAVLEAIQQQSQKLISCSGAFYNQARAEVMEKLISIAPPGCKRVFLCNSGTESVEAALKFARISTGRAKIIAARGGFHGRTFGAMSATFNPKYAKGFGPLVPGFQHVPYNQIEALEQAMGPDVAAVLLEVVQGESGVRLGDPAFLASARALCDQHGALLILDEVQTGFCRTGQMFAAQHYDLRPDLVCLAKSIAGGLPMGAVLCGDAVQVPVGKHGTTFGGNPLACAVSLAAIQEMQRLELDREAQRKGAAFMASFTSRSLDVVREVRQLGLMIGIELRIKARPVLGELMAAGILALPSGASVVRLLPPLTIEDEDWATVSCKLADILEKHQL